jgi:hypothetical protein
MRVKYFLDFLHVVNHVVALAVAEVLSLLKTYTMLSTYTASSIFDILEHKAINNIAQPVLKPIHVIVPRDAHIQMHIPITDMTISSDCDGFFL